MKKHVGGFIFCVILLALAVRTGYLDVAAQVAPGVGAGGANSGSVAAAASGNVTGPGSSTDNAVARFDGTGGSTLQNSGVTVSDVSASNVTVSAITGTAITIATLDSNKDINLTPHGTGTTSATKLLSTVSGDAVDQFRLVNSAAPATTGAWSLHSYSVTGAFYINQTGALNALKIDPGTGNVHILTGLFYAGTSDIQLTDAAGHINTNALNTVAVANGGTGGVTAAAARSNLGIGYNLTVYAAGTAYSLTNSAAILDFGTTDPTKVIDQAGTYLILGRAYLKYNAATYAGTQTATIKLRRTNNSAADLTNATTTATMRIITTITDSVGIMEIPPVVYTTANTDDSISVFGSVSAAPAAGSVDATEASIVAIRLY